MYLISSLLTHPLPLSLLPCASLCWLISFITLSDLPVPPFSPSVLSFRSPSCLSYAYTLFPWEKKNRGKITSTTDTYMQFFLTLFIKPVLVRTPDLIWSDNIHSPLYHLYFYYLPTILIISFWNSSREDKIQFLLILFLAKLRTTPLTMVTHCCNITIIFFFFSYCNYYYPSCPLERLSEKNKTTTKKLQRVNVNY